MINVKDFGAVGDSVHDDTQAFNEAVCHSIGLPFSKENLANSKIDCRYALNSIYIPSGTYKITQPIKIYGIMHLKFYGDGGSTRLYPVGKMDSVLDINGAANCQFCDFRIEGNTFNETIKNAIYYYWDGTGRTCERCNFHDISISRTRCETGFRIGKIGHGGQVDTTTYKNITLYGDKSKDQPDFWKYGFYVGTDNFANCLVHSFYDPSVTNWQEGIHVSVTNYSQFGGNFGANNIDIVAHTLSYFSVQGVRSETSGRFLLSGNGWSKSSANLSVSDVLFWTDKLEPDGEIIQFRQNGNLSLKNFVVSPTNTKVCVKVDPSFYASLNAEGITCSSSLPDFTSKINNKTDIVISGYISEDQDGNGLKSFVRGVNLNTPTRSLV